MARPSDLPDFTNPPVDEVVIGLFLHPIESFTDSLPIQLLEDLKPLGYTTFQIQGPLVLDDEHPNEPLERPRPPRLELLTSAPPNRFWLGSPDERRIVQLQRDALLSNWRRRGEAEYPRFEELLGEFRLVQTAFLKTLSGAGIAVPTVLQVEVSYTNWITDMAMEEWFRPAEVGTLTGRHADSRSEASGWTAHHPVRDAAGIQVGRLRIDCQAAARLANGEWAEGTQFALRARFALDETSAGAAMDSTLEMGRETIVQAFADLTTPQAHKSWGRRE